MEALAKGPDLAAAEEIRAQLVWAAQDHVLIKTIVELAKQGYCAVTWSDILTEEKFGIKIEHCSAIVDKLKPIPPEFFQSSLEYAGQLMPKS